MTFMRRSSAFIANARVSATETPNSVCSSSSPSIHGGLSTPSATGADLDERALDRVDVARVAAGHVAQEARAERDVAVLVARDLREALDEARQRPHPLVVVHDEVLAGEGEHALDDHVVDRHGLDERLEVLGLDGEPVDPRVQHLVEEDAELLVDVLDVLLEAVLEVVGLEHADLGVEAVEERDVARLVGDLRAQEQPHVLLRRGAHHRAELGGDALLADEERRQAVHALEALLGVDALVPVDPVLREVDVLRRPLLALPERVELPVVEQLRPPVRGFQQRGVARRLVVGALGAGGGVGHGAQPTRDWLAGQPKASSA